MRCLILERRDMARAELQRQLGRFDDIEIAGCFRTAERAGVCWHDNPPDIVFMDGDTREFAPLLDRFETGDVHGALVVLMGNLPDLALTAFERRHADFLLRPVEAARLAECVRRLREMLQRRRTLSRVAVLNETLEDLRRTRSRNPAPLYRDFWIRSRNETVRVPQSEIVWLEAARGYVYFNLRRRQLLHRISLRELEERLDPDEFLRIHRSAIINVNQLVRTHSNRHGIHAVELANGQQVRVGRKYRVRLAEFMAGTPAPADRSLAAA